MPICCPTDVAYIQQQIDLIKQTILALQTARLGIIAGTISSYTLGTGQTTQQVTKLNISTIQTQILSLENELQLAQNKLCGGASFYGRPGY
jgi:Na+/H+-translocating membrane pyrophosphatase